MNIYFCPECLEEKEFVDYYKDEVFNVLGEKEVIISAHYLRCEICNECIFNPKNMDENFIKAYKKAGLKRTSCGKEL